MNNMRDIKNDEENHKKTLVVKMGIRKSKIYHTFIIVGAISSFGAFLLLKENSYAFLTCLTPIPILLLNLKKVWTFKDNRELDPELKKLALSTFLLTLLYGLCSIL